MSEIFSPFGALHALVAALSILAWGTVILLARRRSVPDRWPLVLVLTVSILVLNFAWFLFRARPGEFSLGSSLPLHLCDFAWMTAVWALLSHDRDDSKAHQLIFYWGLGLSTQAFFTPTLTYGPAHPRFWSFWLSHWQIVAVGLLDLLAYGRRPTWAGFRLASLATLILGLIMAVFDIYFDTPYFFTGRGNPDHPTIIDRLGPWPWRLITMAVVVGSWFAILRLLMGRVRREITLD